MNDKYNVIINGTKVIFDEISYMRFISHLVPSLIKSRLTTDEFWLELSLKIPTNIKYELKLYNDILIINPEFVDLFYKIIYNEKA